MTRSRTAGWVQFAVLAVLALAWVYPLLWIFAASLKDDASIFTDGLSLIPDQWNWQNYVDAWQTAGFARYTLNSLVVTIGSVVVVILRCATAGYVIGRYRFRGRRVVLGVLLAASFIPTGLAIIPVVRLSTELGILDSTLGLILALSAGGNVAGVLLYTGFFAQIPDELEQAAHMDGAGFLRTFFSVMLPLSGPITATVAVVTFIGTWSNFFVPLVFTFSDPDRRTLAVGMLAFQGTNSTDWTGLAAGATMSLVPVLLVFVLLQRYFVEGIAGAVKN
ncbi:carbohydrate ABC transporter permease [Promicromonospora sukumoe]|uniref:carbohydrate ABC transporter permease n=1 Tax=Promicromonospora sukumoe TaxID=88382 RepID=UPI000375BF3A|nr:carbohydrate ABC transporter permease [Promicromonospora sukumoe]